MIRITVNLYRALIGLLVVLVSGAIAHAATIDDLTWDSSGDTVIITDCDTAAAGELVIPDMIDGKSVGAIGEMAFWTCVQLRGVVLPESIASIGAGAFRGCLHLRRITIPDAVSVIEEFTFYECRRLVELVIPESITSIGEKAFHYCDSLTSFTVPSAVTVIEAGVFSNCFGLETLILPDGLTTIGSSAFSHCSRLKNISIPDSVREIRASAFNRCLSLERVDIPPSVTILGQYAFRQCEALESVVIPDTLTTIETWTFASCDSLSNVTIPDSVTTIEDGAFTGCESLTRIVFPASVTSIERYAFSWCFSLTHIVFEGDAPFYDFSSFDGAYNAVVFVRPDAEGFGGIFGFGLPVVLIADVGDRALFYNDSRFDEVNDTGAVSTARLALLPGQQATLAHYSSYSKGINGLLIDIASLPNPDGITVDDFVFRIGNSADLTTWTAAPAPLSIDVEIGGGEAGSDRIKIIWANNAIENQWLEVTVLSNADTGLVEDDVFYFGNAIGDTGNDPDSATVNISDENGARQNPRNFLDPAPIDDPYDFNRDGFVNISDENIARQNGTNFLTELVMLDLTEATVTGVSRAGVGRSAGQAATDRVSIRRTGRQGEFVIEAMLPVGRQFELQFRSEADEGKWAVVERTQAVVGETGVWSWSVAVSGAKGVYRIVPRRADGR